MSAPSGARRSPVRSSRIQPPLIVLAGLAAVSLAAPAPAAAHGLTGYYVSPLPLVVYIGGAALAVGLSFAFVILRGGDTTVPEPGPSRHVPRWLVLLLKAIGLVGWLWILAQTVVGGTSAADVSSLFLWVYGWVGIAMISAFIGPAWSWIDPFTTLHDIGATVLRLVGLRGWKPAPWPSRLALWPAVVGFAFFVWLELVAQVEQGLGVVLMGYTVLTLLGMAQFGRDAWRAKGETFSVWFGTLGRLAPIVLDGPPELATVRVRRFASGLFTTDWGIDRIVLVAIGTGSIIYDGLSQTQVWFDVFGLQSVASGTLTLIGFLGLLVVVVLAVGRLIGPAGLGAGLLPIAVGYLVAHYLTYLLVDGQRILNAISDPFQLGWDIFGTAFHEPTGAWIPPSLLWTVQLVAVVGGHVIGAWAGHVMAIRTSPGLSEQSIRRRQVPLAILMVALTSLTLWSLGQSVVVAPEEAGLAVPPTALVGERPAG
jgi:hypothetical protein